MPLETEIAAFNQKLPELLKQHSGRVALFKETDLIGVFDNEHAAIEHGAGMYGLSPFLVRRVQVQQESLKIPALALGVILGNPSFVNIAPMCDVQN
jgi:hypothetical protein